MTKAAKESGLPPLVYPKDGRYWHAVRNPETGKKDWTKLTRIDEGLLALWAAYNAMQAKAAVAFLGGKALEENRLVAVIAHFERESDNFREYAETTQIEARRQGGIIAEALGNYTLEECSTEKILAFLKQFAVADQKRTYNAFRARIVQYFNHAALWLKYKGQNPASIIPQKDCPARTRLITDSEMRRAKMAAIYSGKEGGVLFVRKRPQYPSLAARLASHVSPLKTFPKSLNRAGLTMCAMVDMAALTGQRVGDLRHLKWTQITQHGIIFHPGKLEKSTNITILVEWTPALRAVVNRAKELKLVKGTHADEVFTCIYGNPIKEDGMKGWARACKRAGIKDAHFHDLRAKAITEVRRKLGVRDSMEMGGHATEAQNNDYCRSREVRRVKAAR